MPIIPQSSSENDRYKKAWQKSKCEISYFVLRLIVFDGVVSFSDKDIWILNDWNRPGVFLLLYKTKEKYFRIFPNMKLRVLIILM